MTDVVSDIAKLQVAAYVVKEEKEATAKSKQPSSISISGDSYCDKIHLASRSTLSSVCEGCSEHFGVSGFMV